MNTAEPDWMALHVAALFTQDGAGRLLRDNEAHGLEAPRFFLGRTSQGPRTWFRADLADDVIAELDRLVKELDLGRFDEPLTNVNAFRAVLDREAALSTVWSGPAFRFPAEVSASPGTEKLIGPGESQILESHLAEWSGDVEACQPFAVVLEDGAAVSLCAAVRRTYSAVEAGVETHPDFRGKGFAAKAVAHWASAVRTAGPVPLYSTSWDNSASIAVARKLGLVQFGSDLHIA